MAAPNPFEQIKTFFTRYSLQQKLALAGSGALVLVLLWVLVYFMNRVEFQTLYADLDPQEAQGIVQKLTDLKVPYELGPDGGPLRFGPKRMVKCRIRFGSRCFPKAVPI